MNGIDKRSVIEDTRVPCAFRLRTRYTAMRNAVIDNVSCYSGMCCVRYWLNICFEV